MRTIGTLAVLLVMCTEMVQSSSALSAPEGTNVPWTIRRATWTNSLSFYIGGREALPTRELVIGSYDFTLGSAIVLNREGPLMWSVRSGQSYTSPDIAAADTSGNLSSFCSDASNGDLFVTNDGIVWGRDILFNNARAKPADLDIDPTTLLRRGLYLEGHGIPETHKSLHLAKESPAHVWTTQPLGGDTLMTYGEPTGIISGYDGSIWLATTRWPTYEPLYKQFHVWHASAQGQFTSQLVLEASYLEELTMSMDALTDTPVIGLAAWGGTDYRYLLFLQRSPLGPWSYDVVDSTASQDGMGPASVRTDVEGEQAIAYVVKHVSESGVYINSEVRYAHRTPPEVGTRPFIVETIAQSGAAMGGMPGTIRLTVDQDGGPLVVMTVIDPAQIVADIWEAHRSVSGAAVEESLVGRGTRLVAAPNVAMRGQDVRLRWDGAAGMLAIARLEIFDLQGRRRITKTSRSGTEGATFSTLSLSTGMHFGRAITDEGKSYSFRFVVTD